MTPKRRCNQNEDHVPPFPDDDLGGVDAGDGLRSPLPWKRLPRVPRTPRAAIRTMPGTPLRLATGNIRRRERLLMNSETTAGLLARITRPAVRA